MDGRKTKPINYWLEKFKQLAVLLVILYIGWTVGNAVIRNYFANEKITALRAENEKLKSEIQKETWLLAYYATDAFAEVEARRLLGLKKNDENFIIVPENKDDPETVLPENSKKNDPQQEIPNWQKWWNLFS